MKTRIKLVLISSFVITMMSCLKENSDEQSNYPLKLTFQIKANGESLVLNKKYFNALAEDFTVTQFKFYTSNFSLQLANQNTAKEKESYHLIDVSSPITQSFTIRLDRNRFNQISFWVGVDSSHNVSGAQSGDLDPAKGMFWTWNSGYIMARLEGVSTYSTAIDHLFVYHIGGFKGNEKTQRLVTLTFPGGQELQLDKTKVKELVIEADLDKWFSSIHQLPIAAQSTWMTPGGLATQYADNYATMFSATQIIGQ